ncbi:MAG: nicotinamide mononucleotide transporter family protein [Candidatus Eisenbacteria bacterium]|nr:nicotinamide mononucleotide transporter family protein [Planctomycetota bacterium]MBU1701753.1 nicotinamide mononucleotide transporter family protein [Candidatus Eisenbacteria bacterium]
MEIMYWGTAVAALIGVWLNIHKNPACFVIWAFTNGMWVIADIQHGIYSQAVLQAIYLALSFYGMFRWDKERLPCGFSWYDAPCMRKEEKNG